jgi:hypothetical protein
MTTVAVDLITTVPEAFCLFIACFLRSSRRVLGIHLCHANANLACVEKTDTSTSELERMDEPFLGIHHVLIL